MLRRREGIQGKGDKGQSLWGGSKCGEGRGGRLHEEAGTANASPTRLGPHGLHPSHLSTWQPLMYFLSINWPVLDILYKENHTIYGPYESLLSLSMFSRFVRVLACVSTSFIFMAK